MANAIFGIDSMLLDRCGLLINFFAGIFLASEYFLNEGRFQTINDKIDLLIESIYSEFKDLLLEIIHDRLIVRKIFKEFIYIFFVIVAFEMGRILGYGGLMEYIASEEIASFFSWVIGIIVDSIIYISVESLILISIPVLLLLLHKIHHSSPKGTIGAIGIALYFLGTALQFVATFNSN